MNVEIGTEAVQFPEKEYINVIFLAVGYSARTWIERERQFFTLMKVLRILFF
jgi:hypothetical protein